MIRARLAELVRFPRLLASCHHDPGAPAGSASACGGCTASTSKPLRAISHELSEFELHISPASSSSRRQIGVGTSATILPAP
jgi:hypothetical protein